MSPQYSTAQAGEEGSEGGGDVGGRIHAEEKGKGFSAGGGVLTKLLGYHT